MSVEGPSEIIEISTNIIRSDRSLKLDILSLDNVDLMHGGVYVSRIHPEYDDVFRKSIVHTLAGVVIQASDLQPEKLGKQALGFNTAPVDVGGRVGSLLVPCVARTYKDWLPEPRDASLHQFHQKALRRINGVLELSRSPFRFSTDF